MSIHVSNIPECELPEFQKNSQICLPNNEQTKGFITISEIIKNNIPNYANSFNIAEKETSSIILSKHGSVIQMTYNPDKIINNQEFIKSIIHSSKYSFFHIFDSTLFFINCISNLYKTNIFPLFLYDKNFTYFSENKHPCFSNIHNCIIKYNKTYQFIINKDFINTNNQSIHHFLSPDIITLQFILINQKTNINTKDIIEIKKIINQSYQKYLPNYVLFEIIPIIETYIDNMFTHMSASSIKQYISENAQKHAIFSIISQHIINIKSCFNIENNIITNNFIKPIIKFLNPKISYSLEDVFQTLHNHLYINFIQSDIAFHIIHENKITM